MVKVKRNMTVTPDYEQLYNEHNRTTCSEAEQEQIQSKAIGSEVSWPHIHRRWLEN